MYTCLPLFSLIALLLLSEGCNSSTISSGKLCRCYPDQDCWPSPVNWATLNETVSGRLLAPQPIAISCYPGSQRDPSRCDRVTESWTNQSFQSSEPLGLSYPLNDTCPPVNYTAGQQPGTCTIGNNPVYVVNATSFDHISSALQFAQRHNIRIVIKSTGHDLLGRSNGYGSLEIWLKHLRHGVEFQKWYTSSDGCQSCTWRGSTISIKGAYTWEDVYPIAQQNGVVVVGGGTPSVGTMGGWMQGGGHGPGSRQFGLGADQVLDAEVVLANGSLVVANACQNSDLFFAIRGGGPGTYGVVVSTTIKAWPMVTSVAVQHLAIAPLSQNTSSLLKAVALLFSAFPDLNDAGYAGYGSWTIDAGVPLFANFTAGYVHGIYMFNKTIEDAKTAFQSVSRVLSLENNTSLFVSENYVSYDNYWSFYWNESGVEPPIGTSAALGSRLFDRESVQKEPKRLQDVIDVLAGQPGEFAFNSLELVSGGQVFRDSSDQYSGVLPAWRTSYFNNIISRPFPQNATEQTKEMILEDVTFKKVMAMKKLASKTGTYMNEGDRLDQDYEKDFYGSHYSNLRSIKSRYDPNDLFYCPTCVGSREWIVDGRGKLCRVTGWF